MSLHVLALDYCRKTRSQTRPTKAQLQHNSSGSVRAATQKKKKKLQQCNFWTFRSCGVYFASGIQGWCLPLSFTLALPSYSLVVLWCQITSNSRSQAYMGSWVGAVPGFQASSHSPWLSLKLRWISKSTTQPGLLTQRQQRGISQYAPPPSAATMKMCLAHAPLTPQEMDLFFFFSPKK